MKTDVRSLSIQLKRTISKNVAAALEEDLGDGDITAQLIPADKNINAQIITRESCVVCGIDWAQEVFCQLDENVVINWQVSDGDVIDKGSTLCTLRGNARAILTGERSALNFLQLLSGTATTAKEYATIMEDSHIKLLDTRKTIPGLRLAQKYAVSCGGCYNHRIGLYDAYLIKENHIRACGGIRQAIQKARQMTADKLVEVEVETIDELVQAIQNNVDIAMLDNFTDEMLLQTEHLNKGKTKIEWSGNVSKENLPTIKNKTIIDYISIGGLTKNCKAIDLSLLTNEQD